MIEKMIVVVVVAVVVDSAVARLTISFGLVF